MGRRQSHNINRMSSEAEMGRHPLPKGANGRYTTRRFHRRDRPEKLVDNSRRMEDKGITRVDNPEAISIELASSVAHKAFLLRITTRNANDGSVRSFVGQAGLLRGEQLAPSPPVKRQALESTLPRPTYRSRYEAIPTTCLHNVVTEPNDLGVVEEYVRSTLVGPVGHQHEVDSFARGGSRAEDFAPYWIRENDGNGEGGIDWKYGIDVDTADAIQNEASHFCKKECTFQKMERKDFAFRVGQKIAMAVYRDFDIDPEDTGVPTITPEKIIEIFGEKGEVNIYTGEIKRVTADGQCFEHDINSFCGCSGSVVFLLNEQPHNVGVLQEDHGKAIAIHAGGDEVDEGVVRNFAFKV